MPPNHSSPPDRAPPLAGLSSGPFAAARSLGEWAVELPLQGTTILAVEDSRFACEALRLMARRAGARLRRAETMEAARRHLKVYCPDVALIDLGLPDGRGEVLIRDLVQSARRPSAVLGMSGNAEGRPLALAAGADGFIDKPLENVAQLCRVLRPLLPELDIHPPPIGPMGTAPPDPLALRDDLAFAARALQGEPAPDQQRYITAFLSGIAAYTQDKDLANAALGAAEGVDLHRLRHLLAARLRPTNPFNKPG